MWLDTRETTGCVQTSAGQVTSLTNLSSGPDYPLSAASTLYPNTDGTLPLYGVFNGQTCLFVHADHGANFMSAADVRAMPRTFVVFAEFPSPMGSGFRRIFDGPNWGVDGIRFGTSDARDPTTAYIAGTTSINPYALEFPNDQPCVYFFCIPSGGVDTFAERIDVNAGVPQTPVTGPNVTISEGGISQLIINGTNGSQNANILNVYEYDKVLSAQERIDLAQYSADAWYNPPATLTYTDGPNADLSTDTITATATVTIT